MHNIENVSLDAQRAEFSSRRFLAIPLSGALCWLIAGIINLFVPVQVAALVIFIATGSIVYVGMLLVRFTGEDFFGKSKPKNSFDGLFLRCILMAVLVYSIAIPFFRIDAYSLPLTVGILTGLMWLPFSWIIEHWVGTFHSISRTAFIVLAWYMFPQQSFVVIPAVIVLIYIVTIFILERRWRKLTHDTYTPETHAQ